MCAKYEIASAEVARTSSDARRARQMKLKVSQRRPESESTSSEVIRVDMPAVRCSARSHG